MLQAKNLVKIYKPKKGVPVKALDNISLTFPQTGMVFLLGKSGSGKSTLLNILGGLDRYNSGDILIQGKSTKKFKQSHFDSYRNTYVGFIFQEYNILDEFSVGANIALALQLQGYKADDETINKILKDVDLEGYGNRKPNELSGGQKQRVAIARALVKNPKIIMADEPTGALDSVTGRQVLTTLKKLSRDKLVIVVSHDREFAEQYADRIIELSDGRVIRDVEKHYDGVDADGAVPVYMEDSVSLPEYYTLTDEDKEAICRYIQNMVKVGKEPKFSIVGKNSASFQPTDESRIRVSQEGYKLIKSRLPMKYAFKLGASGLKYKKFRLVMTIFLSCIALVLFGLADTLASYDYVKTAYSSLTQPEGRVSYAAFKIQGAYYYGSQEMREKDLLQIEEETGLTVYPVYKKEYEDLSYRDHIPSRDSLYGVSMFGYSDNSFAGFIEITDAMLKDLDGKLMAGRLPQDSGEIAISNVVLEDFLKGGYAECEIEEGQAYKVYENANGEYYTDYGIIDENGNYIDAFGYNDENDCWHEKWGYYDENDEYHLEFHYYDEEGEYRTETEAEFYAGLQFVEERREIRYVPGEAQVIANAEAMLGKTILLGKQEYTVCGIVDTGVDLSRYSELWDEDSELDNNSDFAEIIIKMAMQQEMSYCRDYSLAGMVMVAPGQIQTMSEEDGFGIRQTLSAMPEDNREIRKIVEFSDTEYRTGNGNKTKYMLMNAVSFELQSLDELFEVLSQAFLWIGVAFVVFASLLFSNFIAVSISYKKVQIGILRAIGSRGNDVFRIFFAESFCIAMINFALSVTGTFVACGLLNSALKTSTGLLLSILNVGFRQVVLLFFVCLLVAAVASYLPVKKIASKRPIDAIRDR